MNKTKANENPSLDRVALRGIAGAIIVALGGAQVFSIAAGILIVMSVIAVASMMYVCRHKAV